MAVQDGYRENTDQSCDCGQSDPDEGVPSEAQRLHLFLHDGGLVQHLLQHDRIYVSHALLPSEEAQ